MRRSLLVRLVATMVLVSAAAIAITAWAVTTTVTGSVRTALGRSLSDDVRIYDRLVDYASAHPDWRDVQPTIRSLSAETGRHIELRTRAGGPVADSARTTRQAPPRRPAAVVDPLHVDASLAALSPETGIAASAVGPFRLTAAERTRLDGLADRVLRCAERTTGSPARVRVMPSGRPYVELGSIGTDLPGCSDVQALEKPTATERTVQRRLAERVDACTRATGGPEIDVGLITLAVTAGGAGPAPIAWKTDEADDGFREPTCVTEARRELIAPFTADPVLLYIDASDGDAARFDLSPGALLGVGAIAAAVLAGAAVISLIAGRRISRPLRHLTVGVRRVLDGEDVPVPVRGRDEVAALTIAFNDLVAARARLEQQRKQLVADVAHDLRTPVATMRSWLEGAQDGLVTEEELVPTLLDECLQLQRIVGDLHDLTLADVGALPLDLRTVRASELVLPLVHAHRPAAEAAGITIVADLVDDVELQVDATRMRQALGNLITNALRHTRSGSIRVAVASGAGRLALTVADSGDGIPEDQLPLVFDRFWRAESSRGRQGGGAGLGLSIVRKIAEAHGGTVSVRSEEGVGSTFGIELPLPAVGPGARARATARG